MKEMTIHKKLKSEFREVTVLDDMIEHNFVPHYK